MIIAIHVLRLISVGLILLAVHQLGFINPYVQNVAILVIAHGLVMSLMTSIIASHQADSLSNFMEELNEKARKEKKDNDNK